MQAGLRLVIVPAALEGLHINSFQREAAVLISAVVLAKKLLDSAECKLLNGHRGLQESQLTVTHSTSGCQHDTVLTSCYQWHADLICLCGRPTCKGLHTPFTSFGSSSADSTCAVNIRCLFTSCHCLSMAFMAWRGVASWQKIATVAG